MAALSAVAAPEPTAAPQDGGPAFPVPEIHDQTPPYRHLLAEQGMSLRDYFAAKVIPVGDDIGVKYAEALLGRPMPDYAKEPLANAVFWAEARSRLRYIEADAMLKMRGLQ